MIVINLVIACVDHVWSHLVAGMQTENSDIVVWTYAVVCSSFNADWLNINPENLLLENVLISFRN